MSWRCMYPCTHAFLYVCIMYVCTYVRNVCMHACMHACIHKYARIHTHAFIHTYTHTYPTYIQYIALDHVTIRCITLNYVPLLTVNGFRLRYITYMTLQRYKHCIQLHAYIHYVHSYIPTHIHTYVHYVHYIHADIAFRYATLQLNTK